jgi:hypothetical protein
MSNTSRTNYIVIDDDSNDFSFDLSGVYLTKVSHLTYKTRRAQIQHRFRT